jgi:hypothetical protein
LARPDGLEPDGTGRWVRRRLSASPSDEANADQLQFIERQD